MRVDPVKRLLDQAHGYGITLSSSQADSFRLYLEELWAWNRRMNLIGVATRDRVVTELFLDSLIPAPYLPGRGKMLDVGSGAGFPGIPLKILFPQMETHLLEAKWKKVHFLKQVARLLKLKGIQVIQGRVEEGVTDLEVSGYGLVTARALAPLDQVLEWCEPYLAPEGMFLGFLGSAAGKELSKARDAMKRMGLNVRREIPYILPGQERERRAVLIEKLDNSVRRNG